MRREPHLAFMSSADLLPADPLGPGVGLVTATFAVAMLALPARQLLRRTGATGAFASVIAGAALTGLAALIGVITGIPIMLWLAFAALGVWGAALLDYHRRGPLPWGRLAKDWAQMVGVLVPIVPATWVYWLAPIEWDARSVWFAHASWMAVPDVPYHAIVDTPIAHPTYPPLTPSFGAFSLLFGDDRNDWILQASTSLLLVAALGVVVSGLVERVPAAAADNSWFRFVAAAFSSSLLLGPLLRWGFTGYVDALVAVLVAAILVVGLGSGDRRTLLILGLALGLSKPEAPVFLLFVVLPALAVRRRPIAPLLPGFGASVVWFVAMKVRGAESIGWRVSEALPWSVEWGARVRLIVDAFAAQAPLRAAVMLWVGALAIVVAGQLLRSDARAWNELWFLLTGGAAAAALSVMLIGSYLATPFDLPWHLATSIDRVVLAPLILLVSSALGALLGTAALLAAPGAAIARASSAPGTS